MISIQKLAIYALMATATVILLSSSIRIGVSIIDEALSTNSNIDHDMDGDLHQDDQTSDSEPILPITKRRIAAERGDGVKDVLPRLLQMSAETRKMDESKFPLSCGAILFYHVPGTGGKVINDWLKRLVDANSDHATYFASTDDESSDRQSFINGVNKHIHSIGPNDWKIIYAHDNSIAFNLDENIVAAWRNTVETQNCHFLATTTFQDPMDHSVSHTKREFAQCNNCDMTDFKPKLKEIMSDRPWRGQLDYLLFNNKELSEEEMALEMKDRVKRGIKLLNSNFDLVVLDDHDKFASTILKVTGWSTPGEMPKKILSDSTDLVFSKELVSSWGKMSGKNGDTDFIDAVNHAYCNSLGYLMMQ